MAKTKKKQLPKDFEALLQKSDIAELIVLFEKYDVNAHGGVFKQSAQNPMPIRLEPPDYDR